MIKLAAIAMTWFLIACSGPAKQKPTTPDPKPDETVETEPTEPTPAEAKPAEKPKPPKTVAAACANVKLAKVPAATKHAPPEVPASSGSGKFAGNAGPRVIGMQDLEALAKGKQWRELIYRASDVPPSKRNKRWDELVTLSATTHLEALANKDETYEAASFAEAAVETFPILRKSRPFMDQRSKVALAGAQKCFERACGRRCESENWSEWGAERCGKALFEAVSADPSNTELAKAAANLVYLSTKEKYRAAPFYRYAVIGRLDAPECATEELQNSITWGLRTSEEGPSATAAREVAARWCWTAFSKLLPKEVTVEEPYGILESGCSVLKERGAY